MVEDKGLGCKSIHWLAYRMCDMHQTTVIQYFITLENILVLKIMTEIHCGGAILGIPASWSKSLILPTDNSTGMVHSWSIATAWIGNEALEGKNHQSNFNNRLSYNTSDSYSMSVSTGFCNERESGRWEIPLFWMVLLTVLFSIATAPKALGYHSI